MVGPFTLFTVSLSLYRRLLKKEIEFFVFSLPCTPTPSWWSALKSHDLSSPFQNVNKSEELHGVGRYRLKPVK